VLIVRIVASSCMILPKVSITAVSRLVATGTCALNVLPSHRDVQKDTQWRSANFVTGKSPALVVLIATTLSLLVLMVVCTSNAAVMVATTMFVQSVKTVCLSLQSLVPKVTLSSGMVLELEKIPSAPVMFAIKRLSVEKKVVFTTSAELMVATTISAPNVDLQHLVPLVPKATRW